MNHLLGAAITDDGLGLDDGRFSCFRLGVFDRRENSVAVRAVSHRLGVPPVGFESGGEEGIFVRLGLVWNIQKRGEEKEP